MSIPSANSQMGFFHATPNDFFQIFLGKVRMTAAREIYKFLELEGKCIPSDSLRKLASYVKKGNAFDSIPVPVSIFSGDTSSIPLLVRRLKKTGRRLVVYFDRRIRLDRPSRKTLSVMSTLAEQFGETLILALTPKKLTTENLTQSLLGFLEIPLSIRNCLAFVNDPRISSEVFLKFSRRTKTPVVLNMGLSDRPSIDKVFRVWDKVGKLPHVIVSSYEHITILKAWYTSREKPCHVELWKN
jgi:hypothetical protein